jgi:hypothetical protein
MAAEMNCPFRRHTKRNKFNNFFFSNPKRVLEAIEIEVSEQEEY